MVSSISGSSIPIHQFAQGGSGSYDAAMMRKIKENQVLEGRQAVELINSASPTKGGGPGGKFVDTYA